MTTPAAPSGDRPGSLARVRQALAGEISFDQLHESERDLYVDLALEGDESTDAAFAKRLSNEGKVTTLTGDDAEGRLVARHPDGSVEYLDTSAPPGP